jgi:hypothetical protein
MLSKLFMDICNGTEAEQEQRRKHEQRKIVPSTKGVYRPLESQYITKRKQEQERKHQEDLMLFVRLVQKNKQEQEK